MRNSFWDNEVTTLATDATLHVHRNDHVVVIYSNQTDTTGSTVPTQVLYRVKEATSTALVVTPVHAQRLFDEASWFPSKWELNRIAAIEGGRSLQEKHRRVPKKALVLRSSFQQMCRLPCYRGTRPR